MKNLILKSIFAGALIALAGAIFLSCENKIIGSCLFSIGLYAVLEFECKLFTGIVGNISSKKDFLNSLVILSFNLIAASLIGIIFRLCIGENQVFSNIVENQSIFRVLLESSICGSLIHIACTIYKKIKNPIIIILCVMGFILSGSLHSIACGFYFVLGNITLKSFLYLFIIIIGNSIGALLIRFLNKNIS